MNCNFPCKSVGKELKLYIQPFNSPLTSSYWLDLLIIQLVYPYLTALPACSNLTHRSYRFQIIRRESLSLHSNTFPKYFIAFRESNQTHSHPHRIRARSLVWGRGSRAGAFMVREDSKQSCLCILIEWFDMYFPATAAPNLSAESYLSTLFNIWRWGGRGGIKKIY